MAQVANDYYGYMPPRSRVQSHCGSQAMLPYRPKNPSSSNTINRPRQPGNIVGSLFNEIPRSPASSVTSPSTTMTAGKKSSRSSVVSSRSSATTNSSSSAGRSRAVHGHPGQFADLPPRDYFSSGASKRVGGAGAGWYEQQQQRMSIPRVQSYDDEYDDDDDSLVSPSDSVSQVSRGRARRRESLSGGSGGSDGSVYGRASNTGGNKVQGDDSAPYWCAVNQKWLREVRPNGY